MMLQREIVFYLLRFNLYTEKNKFEIGNIFRDIIKFENFGASFGNLSRFIEIYLELKKESKDKADVNEE